MAMPVTVVRPRLTLTWYIIKIAVMLILAGVVSLLAPFITDGWWEPGYWQAVATIAVANILFGDNSYLSWTREER